MSQRLKNSRHAILIMSAESSETSRFSRLLGNAGYPVQFCSDIESCLVLFKRQNFQLIMVGADKKGRSIAQMANTLKRHCASIKVVALAGFADRVAVKGAVEKGLIDGVTQKTQNDEDFLPLINRLLNSSSGTITVPKITGSNVSRPASTRTPVNSLLTELEQRYPGILAGGWSETDIFVRK